MLDDPLFRGKDDLTLSRLQQYKLLEKRKRDEKKTNTSGSNNEFLKSCNIRVLIEDGVESNIDRAIELINRTNQLNFTKDRLPENAAEARDKLVNLLRDYTIIAGIVRVVDNYGDYGAVGIFVKQVHEGNVRLLHFCFSCRILGMGVESFVYNLIGRPQLNIVGEVLSNPITDKGVDYITLVKGDISDAGSGIGRERLPCVYLRGGCDLAVLGHYVGMAAEKIVGEYNIIQNGLPIRLDHSMIARYVIEGIPKGAEPAVEAVGYASDNFRSELLTERSNDGICILSFFADAWVPLFRHKDTRAMVPFLFTKTSGKNPILLSEEELKYLRGDSRVFRAVEALRNEFEFVGLTPEEDFHYNITLVFRTIQENTIVFVLYNSLGFMGKMARYDEILKEVARNYKNVRLLNVVDFYRSRDDVAYEGYHLLPSVYSRIFEKIKKESLPQSCD